MTSEPDNEDLAYADTTMKIFSICKEDVATEQLCVFVANRKDTGKKVYILGVATDLGPDREPARETKYKILAEFLPSIPTEEIYDIKDLFVPKFVKKEPLPDNVVKFRKKK